MSNEEERTLEVATLISQKLATMGVQSAVIGAVAAAVRNYPRATDDFDLGTFVNPFAELNPLGKIADVGRVAIANAEPNALGKLAVVRLEDLTALKLYSMAGVGGKGYADILELLARNPDVDIKALREHCDHLGLGAELEAVLQKRADSLP